MQIEATDAEIEQAIAVEKAASILGEGIEAAIYHRREYTGNHLVTYITKGGTFIIASHPRWNDDDKPHDLAAIGRFGEVVQLTPTAAPEFINAVQTLAAAR